MLPYLFNVTVLGHTVEVQVTDYKPAMYASIGGLPEDSYPGEPEEITWEFTESVDPLAKEFINTFDSFQESITRQLLEIIKNP